MPAKQPKGTCLTPIDPHDASEEALLRTQRVVCGWKIEKVPLMLRQMREGTRVFFWVCIPRDEEVWVNAVGLRQGTHGETGLVKMPLLHAASRRAITSPMLRPTDHGDAAAGDDDDDDDERPMLLPVGHISIDVHDFDSRPSHILGSDDGSTMVLTTLFVLPEFREFGLGSWAMREAERLVREGYVVPPVQGICLPPLSSSIWVGNTDGSTQPDLGVQCHTLTLSTLANRHYILEGPEGKGMWERQGLDVSEMDVHYHGPWYRKLGYECFHEMPKWAADTMGGMPNSDVWTEGKEALWWAEFWRKAVA